MKRIFLLGFFDSVHRGHRKLLSDALELAQNSDSRVYVLTFADNIYEELGRDLREIYLLRERKEIFSSLGAEIFVLPTDKSFFAKSPDEFLKYLYEMKPDALVAGQDYSFGKGALGNADMLSEYFKDRNIAVKICPLLTENDGKIATSTIRNHILAGKIEEANALLGSPFFISGRVVSGFQNGTKLHIPTANIDFGKYKIIPKSGVYATATYVDGKRYISVSNVGNHPTFRYENINFETHLIDFYGDLYDKDIKVELLKYLRPIKTFSSPEELKNQIYYDISCTKRLFYD